MAETFTCYICTKESGYSKRERGTVLLTENRPFRSKMLDEERTYLCEACSKPNKVSQSSNDWIVIDLEITEALKR
jgi:hypothetical protein